MKQLTFTLEEWRDAEIMEMVDGEMQFKPAPSFGEQMEKILKENKGYKHSSFTKLPNRAQNVKLALFIIEKEDPSEDVQEKRNQIIAMLYQCMEDQNDAQETLKLVDELIELK